MRKIFSLLGLIVGLVLAVKFNAPLSEFIISIFHISTRSANLIAFFVIIIAVYFTGIIIAGRIANMNAATKTVDKILGIGVGFLQGMITASLIVIFLNSYDVVNRENFDKSKLYPYVKDFAPKVFDSISKLLPNNINFYEEIKSFAK